MSYSGEEYTIVITPKPDGKYIKPEVKVTSKLKGSDVQPSVTSDGNGTYTIVAGNFENSYTASGTAELKATKALAEGSTWPAGKSVTFTLSDVSDAANKPAPLPKKGNVETTELTVSNVGEVFFGTLTFGYGDIGKTFKYEIKETQGFGEGWAPSDPITATVTVIGDNGDGTLEISSVTYTHDDTITNTYSLSGKGEIKVQKVLNGRDWTSEDSFTFTLSGPSTNPKPAKSEIKITKDSTDHTETFGEISFTKAGTYHYVVQEVRGSSGGITYDVKEYDADIAVKDDGQGHLIADGTPLIQTVIITNTYNATGRLLLNSSKQITNTDGDTTESHKIPFELWYKGDHDKYLADDTSVKPLISNEVEIYDGSTTQFDYPIRYTLAKLTRPTDPDNPKEGEDGSYVTETVTVDGKEVEKRFKLISLANLKDDGKASVSQDGKTWTVEYVLDEKTVVDQQLKPPDQTFDLTVTINDDGKGVLKITRILETNINTQETKEIPVTDAENGTNVGQFVNVERKDAEPITVSGAKTMEGRALTAADNNIWKAVLSVEPKDGPMPASSEVMIAVADGKGSYSFGPIPFTAKDLGTCRTSETEKYTCDPKIYTYTVKEGYVSDANRPGGVTNDSTAKTFSVRVSLDANGDVQAQLVRLDEEGKVTKVISAEELLSDLTFTNKYDAAGSLSLNVTKEMRGGWPAHVRSFDVTIEGTTDEAKAKLSGPTTLVFTSGGQSLKFGPFNFKLEDKGEEFTYLVKETVPTEAVNGSYQGVRYDLRKYRVVITPVDGGNGNLAFDYQILDADTGAPFDEGRNVPSGTVIDLESFINTYYQVSVQFGGRKTLSGRKLENAEFSFRLLDEEGNLLELVRNNGAGNFSFSPIYYTEDQIGTHIYTVRETAGSEDGMIYDEREYQITVVIGKNIFGELTLEATEASGTPLDQLNFENEYHIVFYRITPGVPTLPETGFSAVRPQALPEKPLSVSYKPLSWTLQIPTLDVITEIVEVPSQDGTYPVTWLGYDAGLLQGYALPGEGPTVLTGHNHLNTTEAGPFALIQQMEIGDRIFVTDENNEIQIFKVYANEKIDETDFAGLNRIVELRENSLTLLTCEDERPTGGYQNRRVIAAEPVVGGKK